MSNFYEVLGVKPSASSSEIKDGYRRAAMRWHPDRNRDNIAEAERRFKEIGAAYSVLSDPRRRAEYDAQLRQGRNEQAEEAEEANFDSRAADDMFNEEMVELATGLSSGGYNKDVLLGALLGRGVPERVARKIVEEVLERQRKAMEEAERKRREQSERERAAERERQAKAREEAEAAKRAQEAADAKARAEAKAQSKGSALPWVIAGAAVVALVVVVVGKNTQGPASSVTYVPSAPAAPVQVAAPPPARPPVKEEPVAPIQHIDVVAAIKANLRSGASARSAVVKVLERGDQVTRISPEPMAGFVQVELEDKRTGWISEELLVTQSRARELAGKSALAYAGWQDPIPQTLVSNKDMTDFMVATAYIGTNAPSPEKLQMMLKAIDQGVAPASLDRDVDAYRWWSLQGRWLSDNGGKPAEVIAATTAAVKADPGNVDALTALGFAMLRAGEKGNAVNRVVRALTVLAPEATNTWVIFAAWSAQAGHAPLAKAALELAMRNSRNTKVTEAFIDKWGEDASVPPPVAKVFKEFASRPDPSGSEAPAATSPPVGPAATSVAGSAAATPVVARPLALKPSKAQMIAMVNERVAAGSRLGDQYQCAGLNQFTPGNEKRLATLVQAVGYPEQTSTGYSAVQAELVKNLCSGKYYTGLQMVQLRRVDLIFAESMRKLLVPESESYLNNPSVASQVQ